MEGQGKARNYNLKPTYLAISTVSYILCASFKPNQNHTCCVAVYLTLERKYFSYFKKKDTSFLPSISNYIKPLYGSHRHISTDNKHWTYTEVGTTTGFWVSSGKLCSLQSVNLQTVKMLPETSLTSLLELYCLDMKHLMVMSILIS